MMVLFFLSFYYLGEMGIFFLIFLFFLFFLSGLLAGLVFSDFFLVDFLGFSMCFLSVLIFFLMVLSSSFDYYSSNGWMSFLVVLLLFIFFLFLVFLTSNIVFFYISFEMVVVPIFVIIIGWGYSVNRLQSAIYMFLYTFLSSIPFLVFLLFISLNGYSLVCLNFFYSFDFALSSGSLFWLFFFVVFMVKLPIFLLHLWLPKAHVDAPLLGSMVLAGVLLKLGGYGLCRVALFFHEDLSNLSVFLGVFSLLGGCLVGLLCLRQVDLKSLVAYSSIVHMAPVFLVFILTSYYGFWGGLLMMFSHGLCSSCLFFMLNLCYMKLGSRSYLLNRGVMVFSPFMSFIWFLFCVCNMGFPPSMNFYSEVYVMLSVFFLSYFLAFFLLILMLMSGFYSVMLFIFFSHGEKKIFFSPFFTSMKDLLVVLLSLAFLFFFVVYGFLVMCSV